MWASDRRKKRRVYLAKKAKALSKQLFGHLLFFTAFFTACMLAFFAVVALWIGLVYSQVITGAVFCGYLLLTAAACGLVAVGFDAFIRSAEQEEARVPYAPVYTPDQLPPSEILLRMAPDNTSERELLRAAATAGREATVTLLRASVAEAERPLEQPGEDPFKVPIPVKRCE